MSLPAVDNAEYPTSEEILSQLLNDIRYGYASAGLTANVEVGSDHYYRARAFSRRVAIIVANNKLSNRDRSPNTAQDDALVELAGVYGITLRPASSAAGFVLVEVVGAGTVTIPADYKWTAPDGEVYATITANTVSDGDPVEVSAVNAGVQTNQDAGVTGIWNLASIANLKQNATVEAGAIDGGVDEDTTEVLRQRLLRRLAFPAVGGTPAQVATFAEESSAAIEQAFVYSAVRGPGSYDVVVVKAGGDRTLAPSIVTAAAANIEANMPGHADVNVTTVFPQELDVILNATLPLPRSAGGAGGGWRDTVPWPSTADATFAKVTANTGTTITVNSTSADPPVVGKRFGIWDPVAAEMLEYTIQTVTGASGAYVVTPDPSLSAPLTAVQVNAYVSAGAVQLTQYASEFYDQHVLLGPGEKSANAFILKRGRRQPGPDIDKPSSLTNLQLCAITDEHPEVLDLTYGARYETLTTTTRSSPSVPASTADEARILAPAFIAIRRQVT
jgi:uncharacterized phage protein gp47/JayE